MDSVRHGGKISSLAADATRMSPAGMASRRWLLLQPPPVRYLLVCQDDNRAARYAEAFGDARPAVLTGLVLAAAPVKIIFALGFPATGGSLCQPRQAVVDQVGARRPLRIRYSRRPAPRHTQRIDRHARSGSFSIGFNNPSATGCRLNSASNSQLRVTSALPVLKTAAP